ncbi:glycosyltransferase family 2 protein [Pelagibacterales bacterium SAG-MED08]|nr:glycosyltransferase family 2 protein [Pelagibacterales bacterium SAG-MED08]
MQEKLYSKKISILIPTRSRIKSLKSTIESIINNTQNLENLEIILGVDNDDIETINFYHKNLSSKNNIKIFILDRKLGYADHAWRFLEMIKISSGEIYITFADDLIIQTKNWDKILFKELERLPKDNLYILYTSHNQINSDWPLIQITTKEWIKVSNKFSNCFEADTELMILGSLLERLFKISEINISHNQNYNDATYNEGRKKVIKNNSYIKNSIFRVMSLYLVFKDFEIINNTLNKRETSEIILNTKIILFFIPRLIWIYKKFKINFFKIFVKNLIYGFKI